MSPRPEPVLARLVPTALLLAVLVAVATWGAGADWRVSAGVAAAQVLVFLGLGHHIRAQVTPLADPRDDTGATLLSADDVATAEASIAAAWAGDAFGEDGS